MNKILYSFIFVNFRSADLLEKSLRSLSIPLKQISHEFVVANNDVSESEKLSQLQKAVPFLLLDLQANFGFGRANNEAAARAQGKYLVFLNPDTEFHEGNFQSLKAAFETHPKALFGLSLLTPAFQPEPWACGSAPRLLTLFARKFPRRKDFFQEKRVTETEWVSGAAMAMSKESFLTLKGFDEEYFLYYEDVDLCLRARKAGIQVFWYPFLSFIHHRGQSHADRTSMKKAYFEGQRQFFKKHRSKIENAFLSLLQPLYRRIFS